MTRQTMMMAKSTAKIGIPIAALGAIVTVLIWLSNRALANEHRLTCLETTEKVLMRDISEIKVDIKEIKYDIKSILMDRKVAHNAE